MFKEYLQVDGSNEHFNVDVYFPQTRMETNPSEQFPGVILVSGGAGKDWLSSDSVRGKYATAYHDIAQHLADTGFFVFVPSRRGDLQSTVKLKSTIYNKFQERLPKELFNDKGPNEGTYTHFRQVEELKTLVKNLSIICGPQLDQLRLGVLGKSAGGGVALSLAIELPVKISSVALWASALTTSQWFKGPKANEYFKNVLESRRIAYDKTAFLNEICDAIDLVQIIEAPILFACSEADSYAFLPPEPDRYSTAEEQLQFLRYSINSRSARVTIIKGTEHTMYRELPAWKSYAYTIESWFKETLALKAN